MSPELQQILAELRAGLENLYGQRLRNVVLFGSQARGDAEPDSDIDVLVVLAGAVSPCEEIHRTGKVASAVSLRHDACICCVFVAETEFLGEQSALMLNVRREGVAV